MGVEQACGVTDVLADSEQRQQYQEQNYWFGNHPSGATGTGRFMSEHTALASSAMWGGITRLSQDIGRLPLDLFTEDAGGATTRQARNEPRQFACRYRWNRYTSAEAGWKLLVTHSILWNHGYALIKRTPGGMTLHNVNPWNVSIREVQSGTFSGAVERPTVYSVVVGGYQQTVAPSDIIHVRGLTVETIDDWGSFNLVSHAKQSLAIALAAQDHAAQYFSNGTVASGTIEFPLGMPPEVTDKLLEQFSRVQSGTYGGKGNRFKAIPLRDGVKWTPLSGDADKTQMNETREEAVRDVARWLNLPPSKLGVRDSVSYSSLEQENRDYLASSLAGWLSSIESECDLKLIERSEVGREYFRHDVRVLTMADKKTEAESDKIKLESGQVTFNELRSLRNQEPTADGWGDSRMIPANMVLINADGLVLSGASVTADDPLAMPADAPAPMHPDDTAAIPMAEPMTDDSRSNFLADCSMALEALARRAIGSAWEKERRIGDELERSRWLRDFRADIEPAVVAVANLRGVSVDALLDRLCEWFDTIEKDGDCRKAAKSLSQIARSVGVDKQVSY